MINIIIMLISVVVSILNSIIWNPICRWYEIWKIVIGFIVVYIILFIVYFVISILLSYTININKQYDRYSKFYGRYFGLLMQYACFLSGARVKTTGKELIPEGTFLFVSNHVSNFDPMIEASELWTHNMAFISKPENFNIPLGRRFMTRCKYMALDRDNLRSGAIITKKAADMIASKDASIGVYPEGTRNTTEEKLLEFKHGCFKSALWAKCPIVVSVIKGSENIHKRYLRKTTKVEFKILKVLTYDEIRNMKTQEISEIVRNIMGGSL